MSWLFRKWCEWSHVHSWGSIRLHPTGYLMHCEKCHRVWRTKHFDETEQDK